jgi:hypothetical protein
MSNEQPFSELYRLAAKDWVDKQAAADLLEELKTTTLAQWKSQYGDIADNKAEKLVKAEERWEKYIRSMVAARQAANLAKVKLEYLRMRAWENHSQEATARAERRL